MRDPVPAADGKEFPASSEEGARRQLLRSSIRAAHDEIPARCLSFGNAARLNDGLLALVLEPVDRRSVAEW